MRKQIILGSLASLLFSLSISAFSAAYAGDVWSVRDTQVRKSPAFSSKKILTVKKGAKLDKLKRKGGWVQVKLGKTRGWMRSYELRNSQVKFTTAAGKKPGLSGTIESLSRSTASLFGSKASKTTQKSVVATLGVRGLSEDQLNEAQPNYKALKGLAKYQANTTQAAELASAAALKATRISYIKERK